MKFCKARLDESECEFVGVSRLGVNLIVFVRGLEQRQASLFFVCLFGECLEC